MLLAAKAGNSEINIWALICHDSQLTLRSAVGVYAATRAIAEKDRKIFDQVFCSVSERASNFHIECVPKNYTELKSKSNYSVLLFLWITLDDCIIDIIKWECSVRRNKGKSFSFFRSPPISYAWHDATESDVHSSELELCEGKDGNFDKRTEREFAKVRYFIYGTLVYERPIMHESWT